MGTFFISHFAVSHNQKGKRIKWEIRTRNDWQLVAKGACDESEAWFEILLALSRADVQQQP